MHLWAYSIPEIVAKAKPAVVEIVAIDEKGSTNRLGTGFFISPDGQVVTNQHVIEGAASIAAININGAILLFERVVAQPAGVDLAVLKFRASDVPFLTLGKSTTAVEGQKVIVIEDPFSDEGDWPWDYHFPFLSPWIWREPFGGSRPVFGIISTFLKNRSIIQIAISPVWGGSPVLDEDGRVIGVATFVLTGYVRTGECEPELCGCGGETVCSFDATAERKVSRPHTADNDATAPATDANPTTAPPP